MSEVYLDQLERIFHAKSLRVWGEKTEEGIAIRFAPENEIMDAGHYFDLTLKDDGTWEATYMQ